MSMDVNTIIFIATMAVVVLSAVGVGYVMGRNTLIIRDGQVQPKIKPIKTKATITEDPYARALKPPAVSERIETIA
jgi:hypothetical protein